MNKTIFISHRHADKEIAEVLSKTLDDWSNGTIPIFQSSSTRSDLRFGEPLTDRIRDALNEAKLVILIYTFADHDWSWCMWECGVAVGNVTSPARFVVLQCADDKPPFATNMVKVTRDDILRFTVNFHREDNFFPDEPSLTPHIPQEEIHRRSENFYDELLHVLPYRRIQKQYRLDFFRLELPEESVMRIRDDREEEHSLKVIQDKCIVKLAFGDAMKHFGFITYEPNMKLADLINRWREVSITANNIPEEWIKELCLEIKRAISNRPSEPGWNLMRSIMTGTEWWFLPVLNLVRVLSDGSMEFDIYLSRVPHI